MDNQPGYPLSHLGPDDVGRGAAIAGPSPFLFTGEEVLEVDAFNSASAVTLTISGTMLSPTHELVPFSFTLSPTTNRVVTTTRVVMNRGWLLHVRVIASAGTPLLGQTFVQLRFARGFTSSALILATIASGYVTSSTDLFWPGGVMMTPLDGAGALRSITAATPGAGVDILETVPTAARWELLSFWAKLVASAAVANRNVELTLDDGTNEYFRAGTSASQTAGQTAQHVFTQGAMLAGADNVFAFPSYVPVNIRLLAGHRIQTKTTNIQAADQWTAQYLVREWIEV